MYNKKLLSIILILILILSLPGCCKKQEKIYNAADFDNFVAEVFRNEVQSDSITLNYNLSKPEIYGITDFKPTFGNYSLKSMKSNIATSKNYIKKLKKFDTSTFSDEQKLTYNVLYNYLKDRTQNENLLLYSEVLSPTTGLQAQLPVLLAEYHFYYKHDIKNYLSLLSTLPNYFKQISDFEKEKSKAGLFMSDSSATSVINQCKSFIASKEDNYMITLFNERLDRYSNLSDAEKETYKKENREMVLTKVIPAYEALINDLTALLGTGKNDNGLSYFKDGKKYYKFLVERTTGSNRSIKDINDLLDTTIKECIYNIAQVGKDDSEIYQKIDTYSYPLKDPVEILTYLQEAILSDFPPLEPVNCSIKYVDKSLEEYLSPAFYLTPALDSYKDNSIYINQNKKYDLSEIFTTIAHEGYPGHLYQNVYYNQQEPNPIRTLLSFEGYSEGWATYVENYSYSISGLDESLVKVLTNNLVATLCLYAKCDIGINYYGWSLEDTSKYLSDYYINDSNVCKNIFNSMVREPCNYLKYTLGYLEFKQLRNKAEDKLGPKFNTINFHKFILDMGPCQFYILDQYLNDWIRKQQ